MEHKMSKLLSVIGILLVLIGTVLSLLSILGTDPEKVQTAGEYDAQQKNFRKNKPRVVFGTVLIALGSLLQIVGLFI